MGRDERAAHLLIGTRLFHPVIPFSHSLDILYTHWVLSFSYLRCGGTRFSHPDDIAFMAGSFLCIVRATPWSIREGLAASLVSAHWRPVALSSHLWHWKCLRTLLATSSGGDKTTQREPRAKWSYMPCKKYLTPAAQFFSCCCSFCRGSLEAQEGNIALYSWVIALSLESRDMSQELM